jgi:undecaprenyl-diphosphatase
MTTMTRWLQRLHHHDLRLLLWLLEAPGRNVWVFLARGFSRSGDGWIQVFGPLTLWWMDPVDGQRLCAVTLVAFLCERPVYLILKNTCQRRRPPEAIPSFSSVIHASDKFSFPSGHTAAAFLLATLLLLVYGVAAWPLFLWAGAVGASRVVLGVHFPTDIVAGALLGSGIGWITFTYLVI